MVLKIWSFHSVILKNEVGGGINTLEITNDDADK
jgi:hypothetical protein